MAAKTLDTDSRDAISWLPDEVLGKILSLLVTKQAVSTSVLSKKWRYVFRLMDTLEFDDSVSLHGEEGEQARYVFPESFKNCVDRTLALQCDYPIKKFSLKCHVDEENECQKACVGRWISNVLERSVLELDLRIKIERGDICLPPQLFACKTLVKLTLGTRLFIEKHPSYVSLPSLKFLFMDTIFEYDNFCCVFLAGCPVLEELSVHHKNLEAPPHTISSPTVKRLLVDYDAAYDPIDMSFDLPNLVYLEYSDCTFEYYCQVNLESLVEAKLNLYEAGDFPRRDVTNLIIGIRNVEILHLSRDSVDVIYSYCRDGLPVFNNLVNLSFGSKNERGWKLLADLLKQSPKLKTLIIQDLNGYTDVVSMPLNQVKVLHIVNYGDTHEEFKQFKSFTEGFEGLELVQVGVV
ncbi:F-box/LRR-repeat protein [Cardamine amara subsp. amara]|uniref:F-box/LRR-repeat protein n=1 Tax=Cardamine amara subsp. amara TaxID=228776 RepID=A0ABD0ZPM5_CARAN